jgi:ribonuclease P protein component
MSRIQVVITVPKRVFKTAVARNRIKRQIREAFRLQKDALQQKLVDADQHISLMLGYIAKEPLPYAEISAGVEKMIRKFPGR